MGYESTLEVMMGYESTVDFGLHLKRGVTKEQFDKMYRQALENNEDLKSYHDDLEVDDGGEISYGTAGGEYRKFYEEGALCKTIAPYVEGNIYVKGEGGEESKIEFDGERYKIENGRVVFGHLFLTFYKENEDTFPDSLKKELNAWWIAQQI